MGGVADRKRASWLYQSRSRAFNRPCARSLRTMPIRPTEGPASRTLYWYDLAAVKGDMLAKEQHSQLLAKVQAREDNPDVIYALATASQYSPTKALLNPRETLVLYCRGLALNDIRAVAAFSDMYGTGYGGL